MSARTREVGQVVRIRTTSLPPTSVGPVRALVIAHDPGSLPAMVGERLAHHGIDLDIHPVATSLHDPVAHHAFPDPTDYDLVLPLGAVWSVYDEATIGSWISRELDLFRRADEAGVAILGICFGAQALCAALGGTVTRAAHPQIGWHDIDTAEPRLARGPWMQWHHDQCHPPPEATIVATDEVCVQAFTVRNHLGVQFHPEATGDHVLDWIHLGGELAAAELSAQRLDADELVRESYRAQEHARPNTDALVDWFLEEIAGLG